MQSDLPDIFRIADAHEEIHARLEHWAQWVRPGKCAWTHPMWAKGKSNGRQWDIPVIRAAIEPLKAHQMEKAIAGLPVRQREVIRWWYYHRTSELRARRHLATSTQGLIDLLHSARCMLINLGM